jgi:serine/threonine-protein kinase
VSAESRISQLFVQWQELRRQGRTLSAEELCRDTPSDVEELRKRIEAAQARHGVPHLASTAEHECPTDPAATASLKGTDHPGKAATKTFDDPNAAPPPLPLIDGYEILREIGMGGMGIVYEARETGLDRTVALKILRGGVLAGRSAINRFRQEARAMAQVDCPHVVPIYHVSEYQGQPFFTMKMMRGGNLHDHSREITSNLLKTVRFMQVVARAVQNLHARYIVHRDLKPLNILFDESGEPYLSDFGLAKFLDANPEDVLTLTGAVLGTRHYMAPEQTLGRTDRISAATDVWALGVLLFQLTTGTRPFEGMRAEELSHAIVHATAPSPRTIRLDIDDALDRIILRCLRKDPAERYSHAGALADDLDHWLRGEPSQTKPDSEGKPARTTRRQMLKRSALVLCGGGALAGMGAIGYWRFWGTPRKEPGERIELIGQAGPPKKEYRWVIGQETSRIVPSNDDGPFSLETDGIAFLELLASPPWESYELVADIRHESGQGTAGMFLALRDYACQGEAYHFYCKVSYADQGKHIGGLTFSCQAVPVAGRLSIHGVGGFLPWTIEPKPHAMHPENWRPIALEVRSERVAVRFDNEPIDEVDVCELERRVQDGTKAFPGVNWRFDPQGGIGLQLSNGSASFRNVSIRPVT